MRKIPVFPLLAALVLLFTLTAPPLPAGENSGYVNGTVKTGDYSQVWQPDWVQLTQKKFAVNPAFVLVTLVIIFSLTGLYAAARGFGALVKKNTAAKGGRRPAARRDKGPALKHRGLGMRYKLALYTIVIVLLVIFMVSAPLYYMSLETVQGTLLKGLWDRSKVLLDGLDTNIRNYLPEGDVPELNLLLSKMDAIPEARYITITGINAEASAYEDIVWASNDPDILAKINTRELEPGVSRFSDAISPRLEGLRREMNLQAIVRLRRVPLDISNLGLAAASMAGDPGKKDRLEDTMAEIDKLEAVVEQTLSDINSQAGSEPEFSFSYVPGGESRYVFFKPVMYMSEMDTNYFRGVIRMEVSIETIVSEIISGEAMVFKAILFIAIAALAIGVIGAFALSALIMRPARKLVRHVEMIRDTEDMLQLAGRDIRITSNDEFALLGSTINDMTRRLVKASATAADLSIGQELQKKFLPLDLDKFGNKLSTGYLETKNTVFFGYYEGAKGISGDYFDYQDLGGGYYAVIKCDVAGKGVPAALIMIQIGTMFLNYFRQWRLSNNGTGVEELAYQVNDFIETLGFKGRFASFTLCLFDSNTGELHFCNAGDNIIHIIDSSKKNIRSISLPETPAAGVLPNDQVKAMGGYQVQTLTLGHNDILMLYTDGIDDAKRKFRDKDLNEIPCTEGIAGIRHGGHFSGECNEELGKNRVLRIINAVINREVYSLRKWHDPDGDIELQFDFSNCDGGVEDIVMALISIEKMFRCYRYPGGAEGRKILVDKKIDSFLAAHFLQYGGYCGNPAACTGNSSYLYYNMMEDEQYDDLTILGIKRK